VAGAIRKTWRMFEVLVSFDGLDKGDRFTASDEGMDTWAAGHAETGYLRDVTEEAPDEQRSEVGKG
jgi:hypothetical protein